jgi:hypothetical protein
MLKTSIQNSALRKGERPKDLKTRQQLVTAYMTKAITPKPTVVAVMLGQDLEVNVIGEALSSVCCTLQGPCEDSDQRVAVGDAPQRLLPLAQSKWLYSRDSDSKREDCRFQLLDYSVSLSGRTRLLLWAWDRPLYPQF